MISIVLHRTELLVLLDALRVNALMGFDLAQLRPADPEALRVALEHGHEQLAQRGLLRLEANGTRTLDGTLLLMAGVLAFPQLAALTTRRDRAGRQQHWLHYYSDGLVVEQTMPDAQHHRLTTLPGPSALTTRLLDIWPAPVQPAMGSCLLPADVFAAIVEALDGDCNDEATRLAERHDVPATIRWRLLNALGGRHFSGSTALLRCEGEHVVAARNPGFVVGPQSTWLVSPMLPGSPMLRLEPIDGPQLQHRLAGWLQHIYPLQRAA